MPQCSFLLLISSVALLSLHKLEKSNIHGYLSLQAQLLLLTFSLRVVAAVENYSFFTRRCMKGRLMEITFEETIRHPVECPDTIQDAIDLYYARLLAVRLFALVKRTKHRKIFLETNKKILMHLTVPQRSFLQMLFLSLHLKSLGPK